MSQSAKNLNPKIAALLGSLLVLPFALANAIVGNRIEPFFSFIRPDAHTSAREYAMIAFVLACLPLGAYIAARPLFRDRVPAQKFYLVNAAVTVLMLTLFVVVSAGLGADIYRCDVLNIPNCD